MGKFSRSTLGLLLILVLGFVVRLYKIDNPVADWHSWRQADTAAVTRNFVWEGINLFYPKFDDLSSIPSGKPNPKGFWSEDFSKIFDGGNLFPIGLYFLLFGFLLSSFSHHKEFFWGESWSLVCFLFRHPALQHLLQSGNFA